jgi:hypothetical protein
MRPSCKLGSATFAGNEEGASLMLCLWIRTTKMPATTKAPNASLSLSSVDRSRKYGDIWTGETESLEPSVRPRISDWPSTRPKSWSQDCRFKGIGSVESDRDSELEKIFKPTLD